jgi:murein L,D-transpeptidase YcbB/YkuD
MFPNRFNVYLHDTPSKDLFEKPTRTFSSGCIRIQRPDELAFYLMRGIPGWDRETLDRQLSKNIEQTIPLPFPTPVHLLYWTAFVSEDGEVQFRHDIYGRDKRLGKALLP